MSRRRPGARPSIRLPSPQASAAKVPACLAATPAQGRTVPPSTHPGLETARPLASPPASSSAGCRSQIESLPRPAASPILRTRSSHCRAPRLWTSVQKRTRCVSLLRVHTNTMATATRDSSEGRQPGIRQPREPTICEAEASKCHLSQVLLSAQLCTEQRRQLSHVRVSSRCT